MAKLTLNIYASILSDANVHQPMSKTNYLRVGAGRDALRQERAFVLFFVRPSWCGGVVFVRSESKMHVVGHMRAALAGHGMHELEGDSAHVSYVVHALCCSWM